MKRSRLRIIVAFASSVLVWASGNIPSVLAYHDTYFGSSWAHICDDTPLSQCVANDAAHHYTLDASLSSARANATTRAFVAYGGNSDINVSTLGPWDVYVFQTNRPDINAFAWGQCAPQGPYPQYGGSDAAHTRWCNPQYVFWNTWSSAANKVDTTAKYNYIGCHELGHTVGLQHRSTSPTTCMKPAAKGPADPTATVPGIQDPASDDYVRINQHY